MLFAHRWKLADLHQINVWHKPPIVKLLGLDKIMILITCGDKETILFDHYIVF